MSDTELELVLVYVDSRLCDLRSGTAQLVADGHDQDARLDDLERHFGISTQPDTSPAPVALAPSHVMLPVSEWDAIVASAQQPPSTSRLSRSPQA